MRTSVLRVLALLMVPGLASAASFTLLGFLPGGSRASSAYDISDDGAVVVGQSDTGSGIEAFRWTGGVMTGLGFLPGGRTSGASGVSADGTVVVGGANTETDNPQAFRWTVGGGMIGLGFLDDLPTPAFVPASRAYGVSADGAVVVGFSAIGESDEGKVEAFRWTGGVMTGLGVLPGETSSFASGVSADGAVVVGLSNHIEGGEAFRWTVGGGMTGLGFLPGDSDSSAQDVSDDGAVVVGQSGFGEGGEAFRWTDGVMTGLGVLPGTTSSYAFGVSADGAVVVGQSEGNSLSEAFVWTSGGGMERLFDVLVANGATGLSGWTLSAKGISADGQWVVGSATNALGQTEAFVANITSVPIPPAIWLFGSTLGLMGVMRRKTVS